MIRVLSFRPSNSISQGKHEIEPEVKYVGNMHGDETVGREMLINFIDFLCSNYGSNPRVTQLVDNTDIYIIPSMNPDGTFYRALHHVRLSNEFQASRQAEDLTLQGLI